MRSEPVIRGDEAFETYGPSPLDGARRGKGGGGGIAFCLTVIYSEFQIRTMSQAAQHERHGERGGEGAGISYAVSLACPAETGIMCCYYF